MKMKFILTFITVLSSVVLTNPVDQAIANPFDSHIIGDRDRLSMTSERMTSFLEHDDYVEEDIVDTKPIQPRFIQKTATEPPVPGTPGQANAERQENFTKNLKENLQEIKTFYTYASEKMDINFNKSAMTVGAGQKTMDEFVSFLSFLRDTSNKATKNISQNDRRRIEDELKKIKLK
jgi:oligoendopeptidase F